MVNIQKCLILAGLTGLAAACATATPTPPPPPAEQAKVEEAAPLKPAPVLVEYRSKVQNAALSRIGVLVDGVTNVGKAGPLVAGEHTILILIEVSVRPSTPLPYQREFVVRLKEPKYLKVLVLVSPSREGFGIDTQLNVIDEAAVPISDMSAAISAERRLLESAQPEIDRRLATPGSFFSNLIQVCADSNGKVESQTLVAPSNTLFDANMLTAMSRWRFKPLMESGAAKPFCHVQKSVLKVSF